MDISKNELDDVYDSSNNNMNNSMTREKYYNIQLDKRKLELLEILLPIRESSKGALFGLIRGYEFTGFAGLASHGAAIGIILGMMLYIKKNPEFKLLSLFDRLVVPVSLGAFCIRLGNFFNSEINGKIVSGDFIFATKFIRDSEDMSAYKAMGITGERTPEAAYAMIETNPDFAAYLEAIPFRHPAQLYESLLYFVAFGILMFLFWKKEAWKKPGLIFGSFLILIFGARLVVEFFKVGQTARDEVLALNTGQMLSIPFIIVGIVLVFKAQKKPETKTNKNVQ